jgi:hypothetical protein
MSRFVLDKKISFLKTQSLLQAKQKEEEMLKYELERQEKIKQQEIERKKREAEEAKKAEKNKEGEEGGETPPVTI